MDLQDVNKQVPLPAPPAHIPPILVIGARDDVVVDVPVGAYPFMLPPWLRWLLSFELEL
jgi:hypothetical protein